MSVSSQPSPFAPMNISLRLESEGGVCHRALKALKVGLRPRK